MANSPFMQFYFWDPDQLFEWNRAMIALKIFAEKQRGPNLGLRHYQNLIFLLVRGRNVNRFLELASSCNAVNYNIDLANEFKSNYTLWRSLIITRLSCSINCNLLRPFPLERLKKKRQILPIISLLHLVEVKTRRVERVGVGLNQNQTRVLKAKRITRLRNLRESISTVGKMGTRKETAQSISLI